MTKGYPGPGAYDGNKASESKNGFVVNGKYKSYGAAVIARRGKRFDETSFRIS